MAEPEGEDCEQETPPFTQTIKDILERYPDGQIFKEMIQNADDAGATVVQFYLDCREHGTQHLIKPELAAYQGPALISANDAMFSEQDWKGIIKPQQSIKADDPFKVGRFGIGFNSVYHLTDFPAIVSDTKILFFEPQKKIWEKRGKRFSLQDLAHTDHLTCLNGISNFNSQGATQYKRTLFRLPLRKAASDISENVYSIELVNELIEALRSEAKLLLLFLRSVHTIEVYNIDKDGNQSLSFQTKIADDFVASVKQKRAAFLSDLKCHHDSSEYDFSTVIQFNAKFDVSVYDAVTGQTITSHWLVANQVGSNSPTVRAAAVKQKVFPWVGTAVEMDNPGNGRIFCVLPMPVETSSNLPVHVNGMFGLSSNRRSLKWPGVERKNDLTARWNEMLVKEVIPSCYANLLLEFKENFVNKTHFYSAWPRTNGLKEWEGVLSPLFTAIMKQGVICCEALSGSVEWVSPSAATFVPRSGQLVSVVKSTLLACNVKLAEVPSCVWDAFDYARLSVTEVSAGFLRDKLRACPSSYANRDKQDKVELLKYCLSDGQHHDLANLNILPLANGSFTAFNGPAVYMCTSEFPLWLLPNLEHKLVSVADDSDLNAALIQVAKVNCTQLRLISLSNIATLLDECMFGWKNDTVVHFPNQSLPSDWFSNFWTWVRNKELQTFQNKLLLPIQCAYNVPVADQFDVIKLTASQPVLYIPSHSDCSKTVLSALDKLGIRYCPQTSFPYVRHSQLTSYIKEYSPSALLDVIALKGNCASISFTAEEAEGLRTFLYPVNLIQQNKTFLQNLRIFSTCVNSSNGLYSLSQVCQISLLKQVVVQPATTIDLSVLPANVLIFSSSDYYQNQLLQKLGHSVCDGVTFLTLHILPKLNAMGEVYIDPIMTRVLDMYPTLSYSNSAITTVIQELRFVKAVSGERKRPCDLYDPSDSSLCDIYKGQGVFPCAPYDSTKHINTLRLCGLRTTVGPQEILDLVYSISLPPSSLPQEVDKTEMLRVRTIMKYISSASFQTRMPGSYTVHKSINRGYAPFLAALQLISSHRSWLPVLAERPSNYPAKLPWKGSGYTSHFISLQGFVCVSSSTSSNAPLLYGSQAFFTEMIDLIDDEELDECLVEHFQEVIATTSVLTPDELLKIVQCIYFAMSQNRQLQKDLKTMKEWVYIKKYHKFVSIDSVALGQNPGFRHNMEPYLHILPDSISSYFPLFKGCGMNETISEAQIVSVLGRIRDKNKCSVPSKEAWSTVMAILNWLTDNGTKEAEHDSIYVPADSDSQWPDLREPEDLVYTDNEFLKTVVTSSENDEARTYVHNRINQSLAKSLKITALSEELDISEDTFEDAGQHEPLITRLKNILRDYKDGLTIVKELIQNADDAEATEVNICFDTRHHTSERNRLFFPDMAESHGPALVIHNNSKFSDEDFVNIQKLAGATKQSKHLKIGKFGVGFCSAYHITDVPSFISRERLYIFDPTLHHLREAVKNPSQPGKKVNYLTKFIQQSKQLEPYEGLFGFKKNAEYNGTMFRLPFRTSASELSSTCYSTSTVTDLLEDIKKSGDQLLLFLQNVKRITMQRFDAGKTSPEVLYELRKSTLQQGLSLPLTNASLINLESIVSGRTTTNIWLVATRETTHNKKPAVANVACSLITSRSSETTYTVNSSLAGETFCFLPLSRTTGLPVHVSCNFAVINNRTGIWTSSHEGSLQSQPEVQWNTYLMEEVIPVAYSKLLIALKTLVEGRLVETYNFYCLWPLSSKLEQKNPWEKCVTSLYTSAVLKDLFYSKITAQWLSQRESKFLNPDILGHPGQLTCVLDIISHLKLPLVNMPTPYKSHLELKHECLTEKEFVKLFFANLPKLQAISASRDDVILYMLEAYASEYDDDSDFVSLLKSKFKHAFIPTAPDGRVLRRPTEVVSPKASFAGLFDESDHRFPLGLLANRHQAMTALQHAGMMHKTLSWDLIIDRAQSVGGMMKRDKVKALERVKLILSTLSTSVKGKPPTGGVNIADIKFLPVISKPKDYPLPWFGDNCHLLAGRELVLSEKYTEQGSDKVERIAGSQVTFLCEDLPKHGGCGYVNDKSIRKLLQLRSSPDLHEVVTHLKEIIDQFNSSHPPKQDWITESCRSIYSFIEANIRHSGDEELKKLKLGSVPCIWNRHKFLDVSCVARNWKLENGPFLYTAPPSLSSKEKLSSSLGIKENFTIADALKALKVMKSHSGSQPIDEPCDMLFTEILSIFQNHSSKELKDLSDVVYLPDRNNILHKASDLVFNDASWAPLAEGSIQVSEKLPRDMATSLGVRLVRSKILEQYISKVEHFIGGSFGQHEELTRRIQNIIRDYPFDITVIKELLQNADDAKANKMYIILDNRTHGKSSVLSEEWQKLQGPALLVWNDSVFSEADLQGIQDLGLGSKRDQSDTIGQYGIGFNVVYHLTDCPSFITNGDTLCVFDPHCRYVPEAKEKKPGARYDNLKSGFWKEFADLSSAYLQDGLTGLPEELLGGSLFRFPIRHTYSMMKSSKIVDSDTSILDAKGLSGLVMDWMLKMKEAMLFLNNVTEIKYIEIEEGDHSPITKFHFKTELSVSTGLKSSFQKAISNFSAPSNCQSSVILYPLTITEVSKDESGKGKQQKWLIQQGVGDINYKAQHWSYVESIKPRHGIATPLPPNMPDKFNGDLFCFLPLPQQSDVPAHINGSFILHSTRRSLWKNTNSDDSLDDRSRWNACLFKAIASSYAKFLVQSREYYLQSTYTNWKQALDDLHNYYCLFPHVPPTGLEKKWDDLPCEVYKKLVQSNAEVLCVLVSNDKQKDGKTTVSVEWHPLISPTKAKQVHFWSDIPGCERKIIHPVLQSIGMKITSAPPRKMDYLNSIMLMTECKETKTICARSKKKAQHKKSSKGAENADRRKIPALTPSTVFRYYTMYSPFSTTLGMQPCSIVKTEFKHVNNLLLFVKYLVKAELEFDDSESKQNLPSQSSSHSVETKSCASQSYSGNDNGTGHKFPESPTSHFLLLTADGILRAFDDSCKTLNSAHLELFPSCLKMFLHPALQEINFDPSYFICSEDIEDENAVQRVLSVFEGTLPHKMHKVKSVTDASSIISKEKLSGYWKCLENDKVLASFSPKILSEWTLLLTTDNRLFSTANEMLPSCLPSEPDDLLNHVCDIMMKLKIPFLNKDVITAKVSVCPALSDHDNILSYFCHVNEDTPLTAVLKNSHIETLVQYFSSAAKPGDDKWVQKVSSLPFFEDISNNYSVIVKNKTYIWPSQASDVGYNKWVNSLDILFVKANARWTILGSPEQLHIQSISTEKLYVDYIFPNFELLEEAERYKHLDHIKQHLHSSANNYKDQEITSYIGDEEKSKIRTAKRFIEGLMSVKCIGPDHCTLQPISAFCDHTVKIYTIFSDDFQTLPKQLQSSDWLEFLKKLGLQQTLTQTTYLDLCKKTAAKNVDDVKASSEILLEYIFNRKNADRWSKDKYFFSQVSSIPFILTCDTSSVLWIEPGKCQANQLVALNGAASRSMMNLMWTVRPIIELPDNITWAFWDTCSLLDNLSITTSANVSDVVANLQNICSRSPFANEDLFNNYPKHLTAPENGSLLEVVEEHLKFLNINIHNEEFKAEVLARSPCIPVYCHSSNKDKDKKKMVLVKPSSALVSDYLVNSFHPYLHHVPIELTNSMQVLTEIGIRNNLEVHHIQIVLEMIHHHSEGAELDPNARLCVKKAMEFLGSSLTNSKATAKVLSPLYLPDTDNKLKLSTTMLYGDTLSYFGHMTLNLGDTQYSHFDIIEDSYGVAALDICRLLPEQLRPLGMSKKFKLVPNKGCFSVEPSDISSSVECSLRNTANSVAVVKVYNKFIPNKTNAEELKHEVEEFFSSLQVTTKHDLHSQIVLRESGQVVGNMKSHFYLESHELPFMLYIDEDFDDEDDIVAEITEHLCTRIFRTFPTDVDLSVKTKLQNFIIKYLMAKPSKKQNILMRYRIEFRNPPEYSKFKFEFGEEIPECYHHRLDQHPHNLFRPMEYVGYEDKENHITVAQVVHLVQSEDGNPLTMIYHIYTSKEDQEGKDVSIFYLYKFLTGTRKNRASVTAEDEGRALVPYNESELTDLRSYLHEGSLADIKENIRKELKEKWKLNRVLRNKAIKRLYLKWHPDKNLDDTERAQEVFHFLCEEIQRLKQMEDTEIDPNHDDDLEQASAGDGDEGDAPGYNFHMWDQVARGHQDAFRNEEEYVRENPRVSSPPFRFENERKPEEGERWVKQAQTEYNVVCDIYSRADTSNGYGSVCFMAHQVAEKALKGGVYALCGLDGRGLTDHNLTRHAYALETARPEQTQGLHLHSIPLEDYYLNTRYPNRWPGYLDIPADHYNSEQAEEAKDNAKKILDAVKAIMNM